MEKANTPTTFSTLAEMNVSSEQRINCSQFAFTDKTVSASIIYYRLKLIGFDGQVQYSNIMAFRSGSQLKQFKVYPNIIQSSATLSIKTENAGTGVLQVIDYSGRVRFEEKISLNDGDNNIPVILAGLYPGNYLAVFRADNKVYNQKIIKK